MNNVIEYKVHEIDATLDFCRLREKGFCSLLE